MEHICIRSRLISWIILEIKCYNILTVFFLRIQPWHFLIHLSPLFFLKLVIFILKCFQTFLLSRWKRALLEQTVDSIRSRISPVIQDSLNILKDLWSMYWLFSKITITFSLSSFEFSKPYHQIFDIFIKT